MVSAYLNKVAESTAWPEPGRPLARDSDCHSGQPELNRQCPEDRDSLFGLSNALVMQGKENEAAPLREKVKQVELLNSLVHRATNPSDRGRPEFLRELGAACAALGRDGEARAWYKLAIASDPLDTIAQQSLFQINARMKRYPDPPKAPKG